MASDKRQVILDTASDLMASFLYYDRKEDEDLGRGEIEAAIAQGVVTIDELVAIFRKALEGATNEPRTVKGPCFDCNEQCCFGKSGCVKDHIITMCDCHCDDAEQTAPVPKLDPETGPNVPSRMMA